jgi:hypothetical protein
MPPESSDSQPQYTHPSLSFLIPPINSTTLKPVLKKPSPRASLVLQKDYWIRNDRYWSKCASDSGKQSVRFHPDITEVSYLPESPVKGSLHTSYFDKEEDEEEDEEEMWQVIVLVGSYLKNVLVSSFLPTTTIKNNSAVTKKSNTNLVQLCTSAVSFTAWFMYQNVMSVLNRALGQKPKDEQRKVSHVAFA